MPLLLLCSFFSRALGGLVVCVICTRALGIFWDGRLKRVDRHTLLHSAPTPTTHTHTRTQGPDYAITGTTSDSAARALLPFFA